ncbi:MAG: hypothetical protein A2Y34_06050 [Spirochaetes bacterium GWC1_27_15]|nr:MAG: hypothetical protein A2Z98_17235 [Spirochaetes bacterium GWB1_27_13]OHD22348.1 MAG: hypothetical protein A2Y34_06050 [Spirochaetes bacterium GWC1_27_15]
MAGKFEIYKDKAGEFRFRLKASNGQVILTGEGYKAKAGCQNGIESIKKNCTEDKRFETYQDKSGGYRFRLKAGNGEIIGQSESYTTEDACKNGIQSVKNNAPEAAVEDLSIA